MKYLLLIYTVEADWAKNNPDPQKLMDGYWQYTQDLTKDGHMIAGEGLDPTATAKTVRVRGGQIQASDGPFAETKEQLGGFYLVEAKDLDEAIALAAEIPDAQNGSIEVRPVTAFDPPPA